MTNSDSLPLVSFIIPTLNSERTMTQCLKSIRNQNYPKKEIIIVDGGSNDLTVEISSEYTSQILMDKGLLAHARQTGADNAKGDVLAIFDSNVFLPSPNWLSDAVRQFSEGKSVGIVWPINKAPQGASLISRCYFNFWKERLNSTQNALPGGNSLVLSKAFKEVNGFNVNLHFGEDFDLMKRIMSRGYTMLVFNIPIIHDTMHSLKEFTQKQVWGASSIMSIKNDALRHSLLDSCITWNSQKNRHSSKRTNVFKQVLFTHVITGFNGMIRGLAKEEDKSWIVMPLLLTIRILIYGSYFLKSSLFRFLKR